MSSTTHASTHNVTQLVDALAGSDRWQSAGSLSKLTGIHRDTARRALVQLTEDDWLEQREFADGETRWRLSPRFARIGLKFLDTQLGALAAAKALVEETVEPLTALRSLYRADSP